MWIDRNEITIAKLWHMVDRLQDEIEEKGCELSEESEYTIKMVKWVLEHWNESAEMLNSIPISLFSAEAKDGIEYVFRKLNLWGINFGKEEQE